MCDLTPTQLTILAAAKKEFLAQGFGDASLERIIKASGFSENAVLELFPDKESLFDTLVAAPAAELKQKLCENQDTYFDLFRTHRTNESKQLFEEFFQSFINYIYDHFDAFKLLIYKSDNSKYETFIYDIIRMDAARSEEYFAELRRSGKNIKDVSHDLHHMISSAYYTGAFETIAHDMTRSQAIRYIRELSVFFFRGWEALLRP